MVTRFDAPRPSRPRGHSAAATSPSAVTRAAPRRSLLRPLSLHDPKPPRSAVPAFARAPGLGPGLPSGSDHRHADRGIGKTPSPSTERARVVPVLSASSSQPPAASFLPVSDTWTTPDSGQGTPQSIRRVGGSVSPGSEQHGSFGSASRTHSRYSPALWGRGFPPARDGRGCPGPLWNSCLRCGAEHPLWWRQWYGVPVDRYDEKRALQVLVSRTPSSLQVETILIIWTTYPVCLNFILSSFNEISFLSTSVPRLLGGGLGIKDDGPNCWMTFGKETHVN